MMRNLMPIALIGAAALFGAPAGDPGGQTFGTPKEAGVALIDAASHGLDALRTLFGPESGDIVRTGDEVQDKKLLADFNKRAAEKIQMVPDETNPDLITVLLGEDEYPFAVPLVRQNGRWHFDVQEGKLEMRRRVIGSNELDVIQVCLGYVEAQLEYAEQDRTGNGIPEYAQRIISSPGHKDGLYWPGEDSPVAENFARAVSEGYSAPTTGQKAYRGYHFKILNAQGPDAEQGAQDYIVQGHMIGGFALVAWPAEYGVSGIKSFIVNQDGIVYQKDLGPKGAAVAQAMTKFNPDKSWEPVQ